MGTNVYPGHASIDPDAPDTIGICDRCGSLWNLRELQYQYQWSGFELINLHIRVCPTCMDVPSEFLRTIILPPDPPPVYNVRVPNFQLMEKNEYSLMAAAIGTPMFGAVSAAFCLLQWSHGFNPLFTDLSVLVCDLYQEFQIIVDEPVPILTEDGFMLLTETGDNFIGTENQGFGVIGLMNATLTLTTP